MCAVTGKAITTRRSKFLYKVVRSATEPAGKHFLSEYEPGNRSRLDYYWSSRGSVLEYNVGRVTRSLDGPGIMAYTSKKQANDHRLDRLLFNGASCDLCIIKVRVPIGAQVIPIKQGDKTGFAVSRLRVVKYLPS